ncbi:hypothetical protein [Streptomyces sp. NPDC002763]
MDTAFRSSYAQEMTAPAIAAGTPSVAPNVNGVIPPSDGGWTTI